MNTASAAEIFTVSLSVFFSVTLSYHKGHNHDLAISEFFAFITEEPHITFFEFNPIGVSLRIGLGFEYWEEVVLITESNWEGIESVPDVTKG